MRGGFFCTFVFSGALAACSLLDNDDVGHGVVRASSIVRPSTASAGEPFTVRVWTKGGCLELVATEVSYLDDATALVEPIDHHRLPCKILKLCAVEHSAEVRFATPGDKVIVFRGRQSQDDPNILVDHAARMRVE